MELYFSLLYLERNKQTLLQRQVKTLIYEDIKHFLLSKVSSKEFDAIIYLIDKRNWNSEVRIDYYEMSREINTTVRYAREIVQKLSSKKRESVLRPTNDPNTYYFNLGISTILYQKGIQYGKVFSFFTKRSFQSLSIYAKRILLKASFSSSITGQKEIFIHPDDLINSGELSSGLLPSKRMLLRTIQEINTFSVVARRSISFLIFSEDKSMYLFNLKRMH